jgi:citrate synthase
METMALKLFHPGLEGVIAGETEISDVEGDFVYRGYPVADLVAGASFLEVAHLLLLEELPTQEQLADFRSLLWEEATLPDGVCQFVQQLPLHVGPLAMLRSGLSLLGNHDSQEGAPPAESGVSQAIRLLARVPLLLAEWHRLRTRRPSMETTPALSYAGNLLALLTGREPTPVAERALDVAMIVSADYAFTPSTYAARLAAAGGADVISGVTAAMAALINAPATQRYGLVSDVLATVATPENAERWVKYRVRESLPVPGFSSEADPRPPLLESACDELAEESGAHQTAQVAGAIVRAVRNAVRQSPTLEWSAARLYMGMGINRDLHSALFVCGRLVGWCAHVMEQAESEEPIRPRSRYRGAAHRDFEPLCLRG